VTGGIGCLSYKHPKKITVSISCHRQTKAEMKKIYIIAFSA